MARSGVCRSMGQKAALRSIWDDRAQGRILVAGLCNPNLCPWNRCAVISPRCFDRTLYAPFRYALNYAGAVDDDLPYACRSRGCELHRPQSFARRCRAIGLDATLGDSGIIYSMIEWLLGILAFRRPLDRLVSDRSKRIFISVRRGILAVSPNHFCTTTWQLAWT